MKIYYIGSLLFDQDNILISETVFYWKVRIILFIALKPEYIPESAHKVTGGPSHNEAPFWVCASFTHLIHAVGRPHLTHSDLALHFEMSRRSEKVRNNC